jgi:2-keto-4-pentenoate hydratase
VAFIMDRDRNAEPPSFAEFVSSVAYTPPAIENVERMIKDWQIR